MRRMNVWRRTISIIILAALALTGYSQVNPMQISKDYSYSTGIRDYQSLSINPANIAAHRRPDKKFSIGLFIVEGTMFSSVIKNKLFGKNDKLGEGGVVNTIISGGLLIDDILIERTSVFTDITLFGLNFKTKKAGSFALSIKSNIYADTELNGVFETLEYGSGGFTNVLDVVAQTIIENISNDNGLLNDTTEDSYLRMNVVNEINLGYSRQILKTEKVKMFGGLSFKYLMGFLDMALQFNENEVKGYYSLSSLIPDDIENYNIIGTTQNDKLFGSGFGTSVGMSMQYMDKLRIGMSAVDLGFINWPSQSLFVTQADAVNILTNDVEEQLDEVINNFQRKSETKEILPAKFILGVSYDVHKYVQFYMDFVTPLNKTYRNLDNPIFGIGTLLSLKGVVALKTGATIINKNLITVPLYISFFGGKKQSYEFTLGTGDLLSYLISDREYVQANVAMFKFHF